MGFLKNEKNLKVNDTFDVTPLNPRLYDWFFLFWGRNKSIIGLTDLLG